MDDKWIRNVRESPAAGEARELLRVLEESDALDENIASDLGKARRQAKRAAWVLENCDPYVMPQTALDQSHQNLTAATNYARQYQSSQDPSMLANKISNSEAALVHLSVAAIPGESAAPAEQLSSLASTISEQRAAAEREMTALVESLRARVSEVETQRQTAEQQNADLAARIDQMREDVDSLRQTSTSLTTQWQSSFTEEQSARAEQFRGLLEEQRAQEMAALAGLETTTKAAISAAETRIEEAVSAIEERKAQADEIVGLISDEALIGEPSKRAALDQRSAFWWSIAAVVLGLGAVTLAVVALAVHTRADDDWVSFALKALAVTAIGGLSAYAARQAHEHRVAQREQEHLAVQLAAVKPFLREMDQAARDDVLRDISARLFGQPKIQAGGNEDVVLPPGTMQLIQMMVSAIRDRG